ncbi:MurR/RpiR family transcriptional regulator [Acidisoma sp.]|uniref:MurR/RpiR family transcriptional regulator n=1 Tax=Acidisoma sp. TaxID=1872115 RepID=UPI003B00CFBD
MTPSKATPPIIVRLQSRFAELPPALARVAKHVINYPSETTMLSIEALSRVTESGQASIVRLVHILGFESFRAFKLALAAQCGASGGRGAEDTTVDEVDRLRREMSESLDGTGTLLDRAALQQAAQAIVLSRHVNIYGGGVSAMVGDILAAKLLRAGIWALSYGDNNIGLEVVGPVSRDAVAIAISDTGTTVETVRLLRAARAAGAITIAVTSGRSSPVAGQADLVLLTAPIAQPPSPGFVTTLVAQIFVAQALVEAVASWTVPGMAPGQ